MGKTLALRVVLSAIILSLSFFLVFAEVAEAKHKKNRVVTVSNVCVIYNYEGVFSGGIPVRAPQKVSYRYLGKSTWALLKLPGKEWIKVRYLRVRPLSNCIGVFSINPLTSGNSVSVSLLK